MEDLKTDGGQFGSGRMPNGELAPEDMAEPILKTDISPEDLRSALDRSYLDALRPVSLGIAVIFAFFAVFNYFDLPSRAVVPVVV